MNVSLIDQLDMQQAMRPHPITQHPTEHLVSPTTSISSSTHCLPSHQSGSVSALQYYISYLFHWDQHLCYCFEQRIL